MLKRKKKEEWGAAAIPSPPATHHTVSLSSQQKAKQVNRLRQPATDGAPFSILLAGEAPNKRQTTHSQTPPSAQLTASVSSCPSFPFSLQLESRCRLMSSSHHHITTIHPASTKIRGRKKDDDDDDELNAASKRQTTQHTNR